MGSGLEKTPGFVLSINVMVIIINTNVKVIDLSVNIRCMEITVNNLIRLTAYVLGHEMHTGSCLTVYLHESLM